MQAFKISTTHTGAFIWLLGIGGILLVIKFNSKRFLLLINWVLILLLLNAYQTIFNFTVSSLANTIIFLTIPLTLLFGFFIKFVWVITIKHYVSLLFLVYCISLCGMYYISSIIESSYVLLFPEDKLTMEWIVKNTSSESRFLINSFYWGEDLAPSDGGGWLTMLANRETILYDPSIVNNSLQNIDYIYLGKGRGIITEGFILSNGQFSLVYENNSVKIFKRNNK